MTAPTAPIDADLAEWDMISYFVLEASAVWRTQDLATAGVATWTKVFDSATQFTGGEFSAFLRVVCATGTPSQVVYVLGYGTCDATGNVNPFVMRSSNNGTTWVINWITTVVVTPSKSYTVTYKVARYRDLTNDCLMLHERIGDSEVAVNPMGFCYAANFDTIGWQHGLGPDAAHIHSFSYGTGIGAQPDLFWAFGNGLMPGGQHDATTQAAFNDYFGTSISIASVNNNNGNMPKESARVEVHTGDRDGFAWTGSSWVFWNYPSISTPSALAVARSNPNVLYVGLNDSIVKSLDGSYTWVTEVATEGAIDICVDPQLSGVLYYWTPGGVLHQSIAGVITSTFTLAGGSTVTSVYGRIARDFSTGKIWAIDNSGNLQQLNLGSWTTLKSGLSAACGLRAYYASPTRLVCVDGNNIYYSPDAGVTWSNKKGGWSTFSNPKTIHLMTGA
jgi:hypothetical protein